MEAIQGKATGLLKSSPANIPASKKFAWSSVEIEEVKNIEAAKVALNNFER